MLEFDKKEEYKKIKMTILVAELNYEHCLHQIVALKDKIKSKEEELSKFSVDISRAEESLRDFTTQFEEIGKNFE